MSDTARLAEYQMLQDEIASNSSLVAQVFIFSVTATAALIGYGIEAGNWLVFLAPFAVLLPSMWFIASQLEATVRIATYIRLFLEPDVEGLNWETRLAALRCSACRPDSKYTVSITGIYGGVGVASLILAWAYVEKNTFNVVSLAVATALLGGLLILFSWTCRRCMRSSTFEQFTRAWTRVREDECLDPDLSEAAEVRSD